MLFLNTSETLALLKLLSFSTGKRIHTFVLFIKHSEKLPVIDLLYDKDLIVYYFYIFFI